MAVERQAPLSHTRDQRSGSSPERGVLLPFPGAYFPERDFPPPPPFAFYEPGDEASYFAALGDIYFEDSDDGEGKDFERRKPGHILSGSVQVHDRLLTPAIREHNRLVAERYERMAHRFHEPVINETTEGWVPITIYAAADD